MNYDRRDCSAVKMAIALIIYGAVWSVSMSWAGQEASVSPADGITKVLFQVILGMVGLIQALIGYIYISGIKSVKDSIRKLFNRIEELEKEKLSKIDHEDLCARVRE